MYKNIDLHIHTTCSDGHFTPFEIIDIASKKYFGIVLWLFSESIMPSISYKTEVA